MDQQRITAPTGMIPPDTGDVCAAALYTADTQTLVWCNKAYETFLVDQFRGVAAIGRPQSEIAPMGFAMHGEDIRQVGETGEPRSGADRLFSVEDGTIVYHWEMGRPLPGIVLTLIRSERLKS